MDLTRRQVEVVSGLSAGFTTTIITHPLDLIKVRLQVSNDSFTQLMRKIHHDKGGFIKYYRGIAPNLVGNILAWSGYFSLYAEFKSIIPNTNSTVNYFCSSVLAGISTSLLTNPIWVLKTRIVGNPSGNRSMITLAGQIFRNEGIKAFWKGTIPSLFLVFQASLQFTFYDHGKAWIGHDLSTGQYLYLSATSKILSMCIMYPTQVVKSRLQFTTESKSIRTTLLEVWNQRAFYNGLGANLMRVVPATCVTFVVYELTKNFLSK
jgi:solute carrier family 25 folate transporter 32